MIQMQINPMNVALIIWKLKRVSSRLGVLGILGIGLLLLSILLFIFRILPISTVLESGKYELEQFQKGIVAKPIEDKATLANSDLDIVDFYSQFPKRSDLSVSLKGIKKAANKSGLDLDRGNYKFALVSNDKIKSQTISQYEIKLPISGNYKQIRTFINHALSQLPTLALSELEFQRDSISSSNIDANLTFILFAKGDK
jgi:Tfp pilus assembly protein PilO